MILRRQPDPLTVVHDLDPAHIYAGMVIGDTWVQSLLMRQDPMGASHLIQAKTVHMPVADGLTPSLPELQMAMARSWTGLTGKRIEYGHFALCLPPWCTRTSRARAAIDIPSIQAMPGLRCPTVTRFQRRCLERQLVTDLTSSSYVVADLQPLAFILDSGRRVMDPIGNTSHKLAMEAQVVLSERGATHAILAILNKLGATVDVMVTPFSTPRHVLTDEESAQGAVVIDMDTRHTCLAFFHNRTLGFTKLVEGGSDELHARVTDELGLPPPALDACVDAWKESLSPDTNTQIWNLPLFRQSLQPRTLRRLSITAASMLEGRLRDIQHGLTVAEQEMMMQIRHVVLVGDDFLSLQALTDLCSDRLERPCRWIRPHQGRHGIRLTASSRTLATLREGTAATDRPATFLDAYNATILDRIARRVSDQVYDRVRAAARRLQPEHGPTFTAPRPRPTASPRVSRSTVAEPASAAAFQSLLF